jgi:hypothetical protein
MYLESERLKIAELGIDHEENVAAAAPVTTVGPAARNVFLAAKGDTTIPAVSGRHVDLCFIEEHGRPGTRDGRPQIAQRPLFDDNSYEASFFPCAKNHGPADLGEKRVVAADADVLTGTEAGASLTY